MKDFHEKFTWCSMCWRYEPSDVPREENKSTPLPKDARELEKELLRVGRKLDALERKEQQKQKRRILAGKSWKVVRK